MTYTETIASHHYRLSKMLLSNGTRGLTRRRLMSMISMRICGSCLERLTIKASPGQQETALS